MAKISTSTNIDWVQVQEQGGAPATPDSGYGRIYCKSTGLYFVGDNGVEVALSGGITTITFIIDGGGSAITTGVKGDLEIPFACTLSAWTILADQSGAIKIDVWKDTYANFPPTDADSITNSHEPEIAASGTKAQDTDISDWADVTVDAGDILRFNVDSAATITRATLSIKAIKS